MKERISRKCCERCGERIRGSVWRMNKKTLCGLCVDDEINALGYGTPRKITPKMKCPNDRSTMELLGSRVSDDERQVLTHYCCLTCGKRVLHSETNPRYVPTPKGTAGPPRYRMPILDEALEAERDIIQIAIQHAGITIAPPLTPRQIIAIGAHKPNGIHAKRPAAP